MSSAGSSSTNARTNARTNDTSSCSSTGSYDSVAFFFIKPGAVTDAVEQLVHTRLSEFGVSVLEEGRLCGSELVSVIDKHYSTLAERALYVRPADLPVPPEQARTAFIDAFGVSWADALRQGLVLNFAEASNIFLKGASPTEIEAAWRAGKCVKLFPGTYVAAVARPDLKDSDLKDSDLKNSGRVFVVNGFYGAMRELFVQAPAGVAWKVVAWNSSSSSRRPSSPTSSSTSLSWADFREQVVGATDPAKALPTSLRGELLLRWQSLGLDKPPAGADNGFHASASPLESLCVATHLLHEQCSPELIFAFCITFDFDFCLLLLFFALFCFVCNIDVVAASKRSGAAVDAVLQAL